MVRQILTFSRQHDQERKPIQCGPIIKEVLKLLRSSLPTTIEIRQDIVDDLDNVLADPTQIRQVLMNLCTNAGHAMEEKGGILEVTLAPAELDTEFTDKYPDINPGRYLRLTVSDTGHGMTADVMENIFDPYFTTKEVDEGTGLGLSTVYGIVKSYGGEITVHSGPDKGTTFHVYLPVIDREEEPEKEIQGPIPTGNERILFVDDEQPLIGVAKQMLESLGYKVVTRTSSIEALGLFQAKPDEFDLVITDMTMPNMTGDKLAGELMRIRPDIPIILCTGFSKKIKADTAEALGIRMLIMKPIIMREMAQAIRRVLDQRTGN